MVARVLRFCQRAVRDDGSGSASFRHLGEGSLVEIRDGVGDAFLDAFFQDFGHLVAPAPTNGFCHDALSGGKTVQIEFRSSVNDGTVAGCGSFREVGEFFGD